MSVALSGVHILACRLLAHLSELYILAWSLKAVKLDEQAQLGAPAASVMCCPNLAIECLHAGQYVCACMDVV